MQVAVFGAGYVGLVTGACFAELGHDVVVRDVVEAKIDALRRGDVPIHEHGLDELLERNRERLRFTTDVGEAVEGADVVYVAVGTPPTYSGDADLSAVWTVVDELPQVERRIVVAMKSTVPVGTGRAVRHRLDDRGLANVGYVSNPEFTAEGTAVQDFMHPDRIVIGAFDDDDGDVVAKLHEGIDAPVVRCDVASAEMVKLAANAALVTRISFINEIANVCEATGADVDDGGRGHRARPPDRAVVPACRHRLRRQLLPEGLARAQAARGELGLQLPAPERRHRGERAPEAARHREARAAPRPAPRQEDRAPRPRVQAGHRRHARGAEPRARRAPARRGRRGARLGPGRGRRGAPPRRRDRRHGARGARRRRRRGARHGVARAPRARLGRRGDAHAERVIVDGRNLLDPDELRALGFDYEGIGRPSHDVFPR